MVNAGPRSRAADGKCMSWYCPGPGLDALSPRWDKAPPCAGRTPNVTPFRRDGERFLFFFPLDPPTKASSSDASSSQAWYSPGPGVSCASTAFALSGRAAMVYAGASLKGRATASVTYAAGPGECFPAESSPECVAPHASRPLSVGPGFLADVAPAPSAGLPGAPATGRTTSYAPGPGTDAAFFSPATSGTRPYIVNAGASLPTASLTSAYAPGPGDGDGDGDAPGDAAPPMVNAGPPPSIPSPGRAASYSPGPGVSPARDKSIAPPGSRCASVNAGPDPRLFRPRGSFSSSRSPCFLRDPGTSYAPGPGVDARASDFSSSLRNPKVNPVLGRPCFEGLRPSVAEGSRASPELSSPSYSPGPGVAPARDAAALFSKRRGPPPNVNDGATARAPFALSRTFRPTTSRSLKYEPGAGASFPGPEDAQSGPTRPPNVNFLEPGDPAAAPAAAAAAESWYAPGPGVSCGPGARSLPMSSLPPPKENFGPDAPTREGERAGS
jgi:hypothetical protein